MKKYIYSIALCLLAFAVSCQQQMNEVRQDIQILENSTVYEWVVKYMDADEPKPFELIPNGTHESNYSYRLVCKDYGLFKIHVYGNYMGQTIAYGQLNVVAIP